MGALRFGLDGFIDFEYILQGVGISESRHLCKLILYFIDFKQKYEILFFVPKPGVGKIFQNILIEMISNQFANTFQLCVQ